MGILTKPGQYFRIFGIEIDRDRVNVSIRVKVYSSQNTRSASIAQNSSTREFKVKLENIIDSKKVEAEKYVTEKMNIAAETRAAVKVKNEQLKDIGRDPMSQKDEKSERQFVINRLITAKSKALAEDSLDSILDMLTTGKDVYKATYKYLALLPEFAGSKAV